MIRKQPFGEQVAHWINSFLHYRCSNDKKIIIIMVFWVNHEMFDVGLNIC